MAQKKRKRKRKPARAPEQEPYPGWMWMLFGLSIGLSVAVAIYMKEQRGGPPPASAAGPPASLSQPMVATPAQPAPAAEAVAGEETAEEEEPRFSFYSMLPNFEVVIPEEEADVRQDREVEPIQAKGTYVLQAGSFGDVSDADRRRAEIALLGIESHVQRVSIDDRTFHRVRIGPIDDLDELNLVRARLRQANIDVLRIRLGD